MYLSKADEEVCPELHGKRLVAQPSINLLACLPDFLLASRQWCPKESPQLPTVGQSPLHHVYIMVRIPHRRSALRPYETLRQYAICVRMLHRALTRFSCSVASVSKTTQVHMSTQTTEQSRAAPVNVPGYKDRPASLTQQNHLESHNSQSDAFVLRPLRPL